MIVTWNNCGKRLINEKDKTVWYFENYFAPAMNVEQVKQIKDTLKTT